MALARRPTQPIASSVAPGAFTSATGDIGWIISVNTQRLLELARRLDEISKTFGTALDSFMEKETDKVVKRIQVKAPVDTGRSRGIGLWTGMGWQWANPGKFRYEIWNPQPYVPYIHRKGTKTLFVDETVKPLVADLRKRITAAARKWIAKAIKRKTPVSIRPTSAVRSSARVPGGRIR